MASLDFDDEKTSILVEIKTTTETFVIAREKLMNTKYFKALLEFPSSKGILINDEKSIIETDFESDTFKYIAEHMKYGSVHGNLTLDQLQRVNQMADYICYGPLMKKNIIKPDELELHIFFDHSKYNSWKIRIESNTTNGMDYVQYCMQYKYPELFYYNSVKKEIGVDFLEEIYASEFKDKYKGNNIIERYSLFTNIISLIQKDLRMSIKQILYFENDNYKKYAIVKFIGDDLTSFPCGMSFNSLSYTDFLLKNISPIVLLHDFQLDKIPKVWYF
jgi:hypothetical protein